MSSLLSVDVDLVFDLGGATGAVWERLCCSDETDEEGNDDDDGDDVKTVDSAFNGPDFLKPLLFWNRNQINSSLLKFVNMHVLRHIKL